RDEQQEISISLKGSGWGGAASGAAEGGSIIQKQVKKNQFSFDYIQLGGNPNQTPTDAESLIAKMKDFSASSLFINKPYEIYILRYEALSDWPKGKSTATSPDALR